MHISISDVRHSPVHYVRNIKYFILFPFQQIRTQTLGPFKRLLELPFTNLRFMAGQQDVGHLPAVVFCRTRVHRRSQQVVLERIGQSRLLIGNHSRNDADNRIGNHRCRQLAARQHIVADTDFLRDEMLANAVVDALEVSAQNNQVLRQRQRVGHLLVELLAVGRRENHLVVMTFRLQCRDTPVNRLNLHHHAGTSPERIIVHLTVTVVRIIAQVMNVNLGNSFLLSTAHDGVIEESFNHFRQYGYNVYSHLSAIVFCKSTNIFATFA